MNLKVLAATGLLLGGACATNVVIRRGPGASTGVLGPLQRCDVGERPCEAVPTYDSSLFSAANTTYFSLPACLYGVDKIMIQDTGSAAPAVLVQCAAPTQATSPDGGLSPTR
jgi:hypothetical protein